MNETPTHSRGRLRPLRLLSPLLLLAGLVLGGIAVRSETTPAAAIAACVPHANTQDELAMLGLVNAWRAQNVSGAATLTLTPSLNAAAAGYARYLVDTPGATGHFADGADWSQRAQNCGFASNASGQAAGGEGLSDKPSASDALTQMAGHAGSGIWIPANVGLPVKCAGIAKATSADGTKTRWIVLLFARSGDCPGGTTAPPPTSTSTATPTTGIPTATATTGIPTATPTQAPPTATATPPSQANYGMTLTFGPGWNLLTLPAGPLADILDTAEGCYTAVYRVDGVGIGWSMYSPLVPGYVNSMTESTGEALWFESTGACGEVEI